MDGEELIMNGEIILDGVVMDHAWAQYMDGGAFSSRMVRSALAQFPGDVTVRVNSGGGDPYEGEAIRVALAAHPGEVRVIVSGIAASAASLMIMSADRIEVSAGSFIMIHDPAACICAQSDEMHRQADVLNTMAETYARVYAARAGLTQAEARQMMRAETWFGGADAVEAGFADGVLDETPAQMPADLVAAQAMHAQTVATMRMCAEKFAVRSDPGATGAGTAGRQQARAATTMEVVMDPEENPAVETPAAAAPQAQTTQTSGVTMQANADDLRRQGVAQERERQRAIREMAAPFMRAGQLTDAQVDAIIDEGVAAESAGNRFMSLMAAQEAPVAAVSGARSRITRDETDTRMEGLIQAMMRNYDGPGEQFRGIRVRGLAMELAGRGGYGDTDRIERGMRSVSMMGGAHGVSDFAYITTEVVNRTLIAEYDRRGAGWNIVTGAPQSAADFREIHAVRFGGDFQLKTVEENGEYAEATLSDEAEGLKVERRGRTINLTFEAVVNDDMSAFTRIPREFALSARVMEASMVWGLIRTNAQLKSDSTALFHANHGNVAGSGGVISVATIGAGRAAMWKQKAYASKDGDDFLMISPDRLIVPPALETVAQQYVTSSFIPAKNADVNPWAQTLTPHTVPHLDASAGGSDAAWYLVSSDLPPISVAYLDGYEAPTVRTVEGMNPDKVTITARHIFGAAATEFRGAYKNAGA